jgi:hypothetical protein
MFRMRKDKELRDKMKLEKEEAARRALEQKKAAPVQNEFLKRILENKVPASTPGPIIDKNETPIKGGAETAAVTLTLCELKLSTYVVEMEFLPKPKIVTYEREIQCDLYEEGIVKPPSIPNAEEEEFDNLATMDRSIKHSAGLVSAQAPPAESST